MDIYSRERSNRFKLICREISDQISYMHGVIHDRSAARKLFVDEPTTGIFSMIGGTNSFDCTKGSCVESSFRFDDCSIVAHGEGSLEENPLVRLLHCGLH